VSRREGTGGLPPRTWFRSMRDPIAGRIIIISLASRFYTTICKFHFLNDQKYCDSVRRYFRRAPSLQRMVPPNLALHHRKRLVSIKEETKPWQYRLGKCVLRCVIRGLGCLLLLGVLGFLFRTMEWTHRRQGLLPSIHWRFPSSFWLPILLEDVPSSVTYTKMGTIQVIEQIHHDRHAFTQGLVLLKNSKGIEEFLEGTGMYGASQLRRVDRHSGRILERYDLPAHVFGEGIAHHRDSDDGKVKILQLTWQDQVALEYQWNDDTTAPQLKLLRTCDFTTTTKEGWGITFDPKDQVFYVSDGSKYLHVWSMMKTRDAHSVWTEERRVAVSYRHRGMCTGKPIVYLNELEWDPATQTILANVWQEDVLLRIHPVTGLVETMYDLVTLGPKRPYGTEAVLNGIALTYDGASAVGDSAATNEVWVTGKFWPHMYRIRLVD
jgi:glutaminyl-peptide cyclotransferase